MQEEHNKKWEDYTLAAMTQEELSSPANFDKKGHMYGLRTKSVKLKKLASIVATCCSSVEHFDLRRQAQLLNQSLA